MRAHQIMTKQVITINADASIVEAARTMLENHISGLPVVSTTGKLVGIVSEGDFIRRPEIGTQRKRNRWLQFLTSPGKMADEFVHEQGRKVEEIMTPDPCTISEKTPLADIVQLMETKNIKRLPVVAGDKLIGIVTRSNLLQAVAGLARAVPDPTSDDDRIRNRIIKKTTGSHSVSASPSVKELPISTASLPMSARDKQPLLRQRIFQASKQSTTISAG